MDSFIKVNNEHDIYEALHRLEELGVTNNYGDTAENCINSYVNYLLHNRNANLHIAVYLSKDGKHYYRGSDLSSYGDRQKREFVVFDSLEQYLESNRAPVMSQ